MATAKPIKKGKKLGTVKPLTRTAITSHKALLKIV
jgi:hypothetical protein